MAARATAVADVVDRDLERVAAAPHVAHVPDVGTSPAAPLSNGAVSRLVQRTVQAATLRVSDPGDPAEREAEEMSQLVLRTPRSAPPTAPSAPPPASPPTSPPVPPAAAPAGVQREVAAGGPGMGAEPSTGTGVSVEGLIAAPGAGEALDPAVQARIQPVLGADLGPVRVHRGPAAAAAAASLQARAFTSGAHVFLGEGESPTDVGLMAHEATHTVQQQAVDVLRDFSISGAAMSAVRSAAQEIPGYQLVAQVVGRDPLTDEPVTTPRSGFLTTLLSYGPFAGAVGPALQALDVLDEVFTLVTSRLAQHHLTLARVQHDFAAAWEEVHVVEGVDYNVRIITRYVDALLADVRAFVSSLVDDVLAAVRAAVVSLVEPLVQTPQIKPWWDLAVKVFHHDPLRGTDVHAPTVEILGDFLRVIGKEAALAQMTERGTLQRTADWLDTQMARFSGLLTRATQLFADAWAAISPQNLPHLLSTLEPLASRAYALVRDVGAFASDVAVQVLALVKTSLLGWLASHADGVRGFRLLTVILGRNPFTGDPVPRTAENLIRGFITLLPGGEATYAQLAQSGVIADAATRIESAMTRLGITWEMVTGTFRAIWDGLSLEDLLAPLAAFERIVNQFGEPLGRIIEFVSVVIQVVVELILRVMNFPSDLLGHIIDNAMAAIADIERDPIAFLLNVVAALKAGFAGFFEHVVQYLLSGLTSWLFRGLRSLGIEPPTAISVQSVITLLIQVLGVTVETLWTKLGERIGPERVAQIRGAIDRLGEAWAFVKDVQERGITAIWEFISGQLSNLWDTILQTAEDWLMREIVEKATTKLLSMLDPTGIMAVINGTVAFFRAVQSAIDYLREILQIVDEYVSTIAAVAKGQIAPGAAKIEHGLAEAVPVAIGFLASQVGLGDVPEKVREIIISLRGLFDQALNWLFDQAMRLGQAALSALGLGGKDAEEPAADAGNAADKTWIAEWPEGGHTVKLASDFTVFQFSTPTALAGAALDAARQKALLDIFAQQVGEPITIVYEDGDRATHAHGYSDRHKEGAGRARLPKKGDLPGGLAAFEPDDVSGHLYGDQFYGAPVNMNLTPMHETLNGSRYLAFETQVSNAFKAAKTAGHGGIVFLDVTAAYPAPNPGQPGKEFRPTGIEARGTVYSLDAASGHTTLRRQDFGPVALSNPSNGTTQVNLNTADETAILALFAGTLSDRDVHAVVQAIIQTRPHSDVAALVHHYWQGRNINVDRIEDFNAILWARSSRYAF